MSLSVARPMVSDPGGAAAAGEEPGRRIFSIEVARFDAPPGRADDGPIRVAAASGETWAGAVGRVGGA